MNQSQEPKRKYTAEFKADVLRLVPNSEPIMAVAHKIGISDCLIHAWRKTDNKGVLVSQCIKLPSWRENPLLVLTTKIA